MIYILVYITVLGCDVTLLRKTRLSGTSIVVTIPSQLVEAYDIHDGDHLEIIPHENGEITLRKITPLSAHGENV